MLFGHLWSNKPMTMIFYLQILMTQRQWWYENDDDNNEKQWIKWVVVCVVYSFIN